MKADVEIDVLLSEAGFSAEASRRAARAVLERAGLTNPSKTRVSLAKIERVLAALDAALTLCCGDAACRSAAIASKPRAQVVEALGAACAHCAGSSSARAAKRFVALFRTARMSRLVVVGGSPAFRQQVKALVGEPVELRLIDGVGRRSKVQAEADLEWADLILVAGASELAHRMSNHYTDHRGPARRKVLQVNRRGVGAILEYAKSPPRTPQWGWLKYRRGINDFFRSSFFPALCAMIRDRQPRNRSGAHITGFRAMNREPGQKN